MILLNLYKATNIQYDTDGEDVDLPKTLTIEVPKGLNEEEIDEYVSDKISENTGFCHKGFDMEEIPKTFEL